MRIHDGGFVIGSAKRDDRVCGGTAKALGIPVISAEYRRAPRHHYPVPLDDVHAVWEWLIEHVGQIGIDMRRIAVGGESAGGGLAAGLV